MFSYSTGYYVSPTDDQYLKFKNRCSLSTMYDHVLMKLPEAVVISVRSLINEIQPGANDSYERL